MDADTLRQLVEAVRRFTRERLVPLEARIAEEDRVPPELLAEMRALGLFGLTVPEEYGGMGLSVSDEARVMLELSWASVAIRSAIGINLGIGSQGLVMDGTQAQKCRWLPLLASGEVTAAFCLTEPDSGSDSAALKTRAVRDGADYVITGAKRFITNAPYAGLFTVMARTSAEDLPGNAHVSAFLVPAGTKGLSIGRPNRKMGQQGAHTADVTFDEVRVPASSLLGGEEGKGFRTAMKVLDRGRISIGVVCVGQGERILHEALSYAMARRQFDQRIADFQLIQAMLADSQADLYAARCMVLETARRYDLGERVSMEASCCKMFASEMVGRIADRAVQIHGGAGYMRETPAERFYRDVRLFRIYEGTTQIQQIIIARAMIWAAEQAGMR